MTVLPEEIINLLVQGLPVNGLKQIIGRTQAYYGQNALYITVACQKHHR